MTAFAASVYASNSSSPFSSTMGLVVSGVYPARIANIYYYASGGPSELDVLHYYSPSVSGGTVVTPVSLRGQGVPSTVSVKANSTFSGTNSYITFFTAASVTVASTTLINIPGSNTYTFPLDYIVGPGAGLLLSAPDTGGGNFTIMTLYWEELRQNWST